MRKMVLVLAIIFLLPSFSLAEEQQKFHWGKFSAGILAGLFAHETGHQILANLYRDQLTWLLTSDGFPLRWGYPQDGKNLGNVALGGFAAEIISSEIMLYSNVPKDDSFVLGWLAWNIGSGLGYALIDLLTPGGSGDYQCVRENDAVLKVEWVMGIKIAHSLWTTYRLWNHKDLKPSRLSYFFTPTREALILTIKYNF